MNDMAVNRERLAQMIVRGTLKQVTAKPCQYILYQGDCRKIMPLIPNESIDLVVTSPPYYKVMRYSNSQLEGEIGVRDSLQGYTRSLIEVFIETYRVLKPNGSFYLNLDNGRRQGEFLPITGYDFLPYLRQIGFKLIQVISWVDKDRRPLHSNRFLDHHYETILLLAKGKNYTFNRENTRFKGDVWEIVHHRFENFDLGDVWDRSGIATFPVDLISELIKLGSNAGDWVLDMFSGSGTVLDVAQRLGRNAIGVEINFGFCENIIRRVFDRNSKNVYKFITQGELMRKQLGTK